MKKERILYLAIMLIILDIATVCILSGIYVNFVSAADTSQVVSIEKWGVRIAAPVNTIEKSTYTTSDGTSVTIHTHSGINEIIAPGELSNINLGHFTVSGLNRDKATIKCTSTVVLDNWWEEYCPLVFKVGDNEYSMSEESTTKELGDNVAAAIEDMYENNGTYTSDNGNWDVTYQDVSWSWAYYVDDEHDAMDTALGDYYLASESNGQQPTVDVSITLTVEWDDSSSKASSSSSSSSSQSSSTGSSTSASNSTDTIETTTIHDEPVALARLFDDSQLVNDATTDTGIVRTGDNFNAILWISILVVAATVIIVMLVLLIRNLRKNRQDG